MLQNKAGADQKPSFMVLCREIQPHIYTQVLVSLCVGQLFGFDSTSEK